MHSFDNTQNSKQKRINWQFLNNFFAKRNLPIQIKDFDALINNEGNATLEFVKRIYEYLTERK